MENKEADLETYLSYLSFEISKYLRGFSG